jgi:hypothetical protein
MARPTVVLYSLLLTLCSLPSCAQQPAGVADDLATLTSEHATHTSITFDRDMLQSASSFLNEGAGPAGQLNSITVENFHYHAPAFYVPEKMHELIDAFHDAGWKHLVDQNAPPKLSASPQKPLTDLWLHFNGLEIDDVTVIVRGPRQMSVIEVSGVLRPLDLVHLSGHFGIPKVDPSAVMVPAPPGR